MTNKMKLYICYEDKGPSGPCGQDMITTSPQNRLYIIEGTYEEIKQKRDKLESDISTSSRRSPKLTNYYWEDDDNYLGRHDLIIYL